MQRKECKISMKVAVLAVQGAFEEHEKVLQELGAQTIQLRQAKDLEDSFDALVLPGGESTVQGKLLRELDMYEPLRAKIAAGLPVLATCAGLILLAEHIAGDDTVHFGTLPVTVKRNAYGRQLGSFHYAEGEFVGIGTFRCSLWQAACSSFSSGTGWRSPHSSVVLRGVYKAVIFNVMIPVLKE